MSEISKLVRQTGFSLHELLDQISWRVERTCLFVNEIGVIYHTTEDLGEREEAKRGLLELLTAEEVSIRYPAFMFLATSPHEDAAVIEAIAAFTLDGRNAEVVALANRKLGGGNSAERLTVSVKL